jgi:hypothetical protein
LIDGRRLAELMIDFDVGANTAATYSVKRVDSDYFDDVVPSSSALEQTVGSPTRDAVAPYPSVDVQVIVAPCFRPYSAMPYSAMVDVPSW